MRKIFLFLLTTISLGCFNDGYFQKRNAVFDGNPIPNEIKQNTKQVKTKSLTGGFAYKDRFELEAYKPIEGPLFPIGNDRPEYATNLFDERYGLIDETVSSETYKSIGLTATLNGNCYFNAKDYPHGYDVDYYQFEIYELSSVSFDLLFVPRDDELPDGMKIKMELYQYNYIGWDEPDADGRYLFDSFYFRDDLVTFVKEGSRTLHVPKLKSGRYCICIKSTIIKQQVSGMFGITQEEEIAYESQDPYYLGIKIHSLFVKQVNSISELQYEYGAYGAIWRTNLTPFGASEFVNIDNELFFRDLQPNIEMLRENVKFDGAFNYLVDRDNTGEKKYEILLSKLYIWDPNALKVLNIIFSRCESHFSRLISNKDNDQILMNLINELKSIFYGLTITEISDTILSVISEMKDNVNDPNYMLRKSKSVTATVIATYALKLASTIITFIRNYIDTYKAAIEEEINNRLGLYDSALRVIRKMQQIQLAISGIKNEDSRKVLCINTYAHIYWAYKGRYEKLFIDFTGLDNSSPYVEFIDEDEILLKQPNCCYKGTVYPLYAVDNFAEEAYESINGLIPNLDNTKYISEDECYKVFDLDDCIVRGIHSKEYHWYKFVAPNKMKNFTLIMRNFSNVEGQLIAEVFDKFPENNQSHTSSGKVGELIFDENSWKNESLFNTELEIGNTLYVRVSEKTRKLYEANEISLKYKLYFDYTKNMVNDRHLMKSNSFSLPCSYNNNVLEKNIDFADDCHCHFEYLRTGFIHEDSSNKYFLTVSSINNKNLNENSGYISYNFDKTIKKASFQYGLWSINEKFNDNSLMNIYLSNDVETSLYRSISIKTITNKKDNFDILEILDPFFEFKSLKIEILSFNETKYSEKNKGRISFENFYFEF